jgi:hypothetical protein
MTGVFRHFRLLSWMLCASALPAGCAPLPGMAPAAPPAGTQFDGSYTGQDSLVSGVAFMCGPASQLATVEMRDGRFAYPFEVNPPRTVPMTVQVAADGTLLGQMQYMTEEDSPWLRHHTAWVTVTGRIAGAVLDATIVSERCARRLTAKRG